MFEGWASFAIILSTLPYAIIGAVVLLFGRNQKLAKKYSYNPTVSVFLPTYNEERNIADKLDNLLRQTYPISEILIYDCSTDATRSIVKKYQKSNPNITLIEQEDRIGMPRTLNDAIRQAYGEIFVKTDCDSRTRSNESLRELVANLADQRIGAASGVCTGRGLEGAFRNVMTMLQIAETNLDSTIIAHAASLLAVRRSVASTVSMDSVNDDAEQFVSVRKKGYRTIIDATVVSEEELPETFVKRRKQKDRRALGTVRVLFQNLSILFNPKYELYGMIVFPMDLFLLSVSPFVLIVDAILVGCLLSTLGPFILSGYVAFLLSILVLYVTGTCNVLNALIDLEISGLMGTVLHLSGTGDGKWERVR
jgi:cellulose synthase/poly-beta-1,6-N-acetylglucosamine synthase-like glycosyltransferase